MSSGLALSVKPTRTTTTDASVSSSPAAAGPSPTRLDSVSSWLSSSYDDDYSSSSPSTRCSSSSTSSSPEYAQPLQHEVEDGEVRHVTGSDDAGKHAVDPRQPYLAFDDFPLLGHVASGRHRGVDSGSSLLRRQIISRVSFFRCFVVVGTHQGMVLLLPPYCFHNSVSEGASGRGQVNGEGGAGQHDAILHVPLLLTDLPHAAPISDCDMAGWDSDAGDGDGENSSSGSGESEGAGSDQCVLCIGDKSGRVTVLSGMRALITTWNERGAGRKQTSEPHKVDVSRHVAWSHCFDFPIASLALHPRFELRHGSSLPPQPSQRGQPGRNSLLLASGEKVLLVHVERGSVFGSERTRLASSLLSFPSPRRFTTQQQSSQPRVKVVSDSRSYGRNIALLRWCPLQSVPPDQEGSASVCLCAWLTRQYVCLYDLDRGAFFRVIKRPESKSKSSGRGASEGGTAVGGVPTASGTDGSLPLTTPSLFWCPANPRKGIVKLVVGWEDWLQEFILTVSGGTGGALGVVSNVFLLAQLSEAESIDAQRRHRQGQPDDERTSAVHICGVAPHGLSRFLLLTTGVSTDRHGGAVLSLVEPEEEERTMLSPAAAGPLHAGGVEFHIFDVRRVHREAVPLLYSHPIQLGLGFCGPATYGGETGSPATAGAPGEFIDGYPPPGTLYFFFSLNHISNGQALGVDAGTSSCVCATPTSRHHYVALLVARRRFPDALTFLESEDGPAHAPQRRRQTKRRRLPHTRGAVIAAWLTYLYQQDKVDELVEKLGLFAAEVGKVMWERLIYLMEQKGASYRLANVLPVPATATADHDAPGRQYYDLVLLRLLDAIVRATGNTVVSTTLPPKDKAQHGSWERPPSLKSYLERFRGRYHTTVLAQGVGARCAALRRHGRQRLYAWLALLDAHVYLLCIDGRANDVFTVLGDFAETALFIQNVCDGDGGQCSTLTSARAAVVSSIIASIATLLPGGARQTERRLCDALPALFAIDASGAARELIRQAQLRLRADGGGCSFHPNQIIERLRTSGDQGHLFAYVRELLAGFVDAGATHAPKETDGRWEFVLEEAVEEHAVLLASLLLDWAPTELLPYVARLTRLFRVRGVDDGMRGGTRLEKLRELEHLCRHAGCIKAAVLLGAEVVQGSNGGVLALNAFKIVECVYDAVHHLKNVRLACQLLVQAYAHSCHHESRLGSGGAGGDYYTINRSCNGSSLSPSHAEAVSIFEQLTRWVMEEDAALLDFPRDDEVAALARCERLGGGMCRYFNYDPVVFNDDGEPDAERRRRAWWASLASYFDVDEELLLVVNAVDTKGDFATPATVRIPVPTSLLSVFLECVIESDTAQANEEDPTSASPFVVFSSFVDIAQLLDTVLGSGGGGAERARSVELLKAKSREAFFFEAVLLATEHDLRDCHDAALRARNRAIPITVWGNDDGTDGEASVFPQRQQCEYCAYCGALMQPPANSTAAIRAALLGLPRTSSEATAVADSGVIVAGCSQRHIFHPQCARLCVPSTSNDNCCCACSLAAGAL